MSRTQVGVTRKRQRPIYDSQHCVNPKCPYYTMSHTAAWCGYSQHRRCRCAFCYPEEP